MTGLAVQSAVLLGGVTGTNGISAVAAGSLALGVFRNSRNTEKIIDSHAPNNRRRRKNDEGDERLAGRSRRHSQDNTTTKIADGMGNNKSSSTTNNNPLIRLYHAWLHLPQIFRFFVAGNLGNLGFFYLEKVIFRCLSHLLIASTEVYSFLLDGIEKYQDGLSFFSAYMMQIVTTHLLYAFLVYGMDTINTYEKYSKTLWGQFKVYGFGLFGATALNSFLIGRGLNKTGAFWATTATFAMFNYVLVSRVVNNVVGSSSASSDDSEKDVDGTKPWRRRPGTQQQEQGSVPKGRRKPLAASFVKRVNRGGGQRGVEYLARSGSSYFGDELSSYPSNEPAASY